MLRNNNQKKSKLQEARAAKDYGGSITPGSGNQWHSKGDVITPEFLIECKTTQYTSYNLTSYTWRKIREEAVLINRTPAMEIEVDGLHLVVLDKEDFRELAGLG